jgi:drug/metabolite transporter (DMT)-like permease
MNKLDRQFGEMMKGMKMDSPSADFKTRLMSRIMAEAAVMRRPLLADYKPVIGKKTWIAITVVFVATIIYMLWPSGQPAPGSVQHGTLSVVTDSAAKATGTILEKGVGMFGSIPTVAYMVALASLSLWAIDLFLSHWKRQHEN